MNRVPAMGKWSALEACAVPRGWGVRGAVKVAGAGQLAHLTRAGAARVRACIIVVALPLFVLTALIDISCKEKPRVGES